MRLAPSSSPRERSSGAGARLAAALLGLSLLLGACGGDEKGPYPMEPGRTREAPDRPVPPNASARDRLPVLGRDGQPLGAPSAGPAPAAPSRVPTYTLPAGWVEGPPSSMRVLSFAIPGGAGGEQGDLSVSRAGGAVATNVNRWLGQLGLDALTAEGLAALPKQDLLGAPAVRVEGRGTYDSGMGATGPKPGYAILGLVSTEEGTDRWFEEGAEHWFVKLVGPEALVEAQRGAFDAFVASLALPASTAKPAPDKPPPAPPKPASSFDPARLTWTLPSGWQAVKPTRMMRLSEFTVEGAPEVECVLSHLARDGGGLILNVNRWRGQLGQKELTEAEVAALERIDMLGRKAVWIEIPGRYQGMSGEDIPDALFVGVVCLLEDDALFLRLVGAKAKIEPLREAFRALCTSFKVTP